MTNSNVIQFPSHRINSKRPPVNTGPKVVPNPPKPESASIQNPSEGFDVTPYLPKEKDIKLLESSKGTHQIPHKIFEVMFKATSTKVDLVVFGCLLRYTLGFHRPQCEASLSFIAEWTGLAIPSVRRGLDSLLSDHLIERMAVGNCTRDSTVYELPIVKGYLTFLSLNTASNSPISQPKPPANTQKEEGLIEPNPAPLVSNCIQYSAQNDHSTMLNLSTKKDNTNKEKKTLSPDQDFPKYLEKYLADLKPQNKKEREQKFLKDLANDYSLADISDAVLLLTETGVPPKGEKCHSPMAFLAVSMNNVLPYVLEQRAKKKKREEISIQAAEKRRLEAERDARETSWFSEALAGFKKAFPEREAQEQYFRQFALKNPLFSGGNFELKNLAVCAWAESLKNNSEQS